MAEAVLDIKQWNNKLGIRIPTAVAREAHLHVDQRVRVTVEGDQVVITPVDATKLTLEQRLAVYDPKRHGGNPINSTNRIPAFAEMTTDSTFP